MATKNRVIGLGPSGVADAAASLARDLAAQMPQWKMVGPESSFSDAISALGDSNGAQPGVDLSTLRAKFLRCRSPADVLPSSTVSGNISVEVFKVEPKNGGPSQVADRRNGKINIVSG